MLKRNKGSKTMMSRPSVKPEGFLFLGILLALAITFPNPAYCQDKNYSAKNKTDVVEKISTIDTNIRAKAQGSNALNVKNAGLSVLGNTIEKKGLSEKGNLQTQQLQQISQPTLRSQAEIQKDLPKVDEKGRINLKMLKNIPTAAILRKNISSTKPKTASEAQARGWSTKPLTQPAAIETMIKAKANDLDKLARPKKEDTINRIKILGSLDSTTPKLSINPTYLTFFTKPGSSPTAQGVKIKNKGTGTLAYSLSESIAWLSLSSSSGSVTDGESVVTVSIDSGGLAASQDPYSGEIVVSNDMDGTDRIYIKVRLYITNGGGLASTYSYDPNGNLSRRIDADGNIIDYEYDNANRLTKILYPNGDTVLYEYDMNGNKTKITDKTGITEYVYDQFNRVYAVIYQQVAAMVYQRDKNGNVKKMIYPDSREVNYTYNGDNKLTTVSYIADSTTYTTTYAYDSQTGNLKSKTLPNGVVTTYQYDASDRLTDCINKKSDGSLISSYHYTLDTNGNRTSVVETTSTGTKTTNYEYDELNRLTRTLYSDATDVRYTYDKAGNRLTQTTNGVVLNYSYDKDNLIIKTGDEIFLYDKRGNLKKRISSAKTIEYTYDYENRLIQYSDGVKVVVYEYNGDGLRISKTVDGEKTIFINDVNTPLTQVVMECTGNWYITKRYFYGRDLICQES